MSIEALIFDVDGTMADTEEAHRMAFNAAFDRLRIDWSWGRAQYRDLLRITGGKERIAYYIESLSLSASERRTLTERIPQIHAEKTRFYSAVVRDGGVPLREGVLRLMDEAEAQGCQLAIASTTTAVNIDALLTATLGERGLERFSVIACGDQVRAKKPAPDIYQLALHHLGLPADRAIAFEDSVNGLKAAKSAGLMTVLTPNYWTEGGDFASADIVLSRLGEPYHPLESEPGRQLVQTPWLTMKELTLLSSKPFVN